LILASNQTKKLCKPLDELYNSHFYLVDQCDTFVGYFSVRKASFVSLTGLSEFIILSTVVSSDFNLIVGFEGSPLASACPWC